jgi:hypothetical protein
VVRLALAQLEASVTLAALIGTGAGRLHVTGDLTLLDEQAGGSGRGGQPGRTIPAQYFAGIVGKAIGIYNPSVWLTLVQCAFEGTIGMPNLAPVDWHQKTVTLRVVDDEEPALTVDLR